MIIHISSRLLRAVSLASAKQDIRQYLNGVLIEVTVYGVFLVATDGRRMHVGLAEKPPQDVDPFSVIVPADVVATAAKKYGKSDTRLMLIGDQSGPWSLGHEPFEPMDGKFPQWRLVVPVVGPPGRFPPLRAKNLKDLAEAAELLGGKGAGFHLHCGDGKMVLAKLNDREDFIAVLTAQLPAKDLSEDAVFKWHEASKPARPLWSIINHG